jgi:hypothetical protein
MEHWIENCFGCVIDKVNRMGSLEVAFVITHVETNRQLTTTSLPYAYRIAKLLDLEYRVSDWYNKE